MIWMLILSLAALILGPLLHRMAGGSRRLLAALDGFTLVAIGGLVLVHSLPEAMEQAGWLAALLALLGFFLPASLERWLHNAADAAHRAALLLALGGLALHAILDGAALAQHRFHLDLAVVLHRLPVGLTIWLLLYPKRGAKAPIFALALLAIATVVGFFGGGKALGELPMAVGLLQGLVSGSLLHVVVHSAGERGATEGWQWGAGVGALAALALLAFIGEHPTHGHAHDHANDHVIAAAFLALAKESAGPLLLAYFGASLLQAFMPATTVAWMARGSRLTQAARGMAFGMPLPICSCGVVPLYRGLVDKGAPAAAALAFFVATPEIGIDAILLSIPLLGGQLTLARVLAAAFVALMAGWLIGRLAGAPKPIRTDEASSPATPALQRLREGLRAGFGGLVDNTAAWILVGLGIAAVGTGWIDAKWLAALPAGLDVPLLALLGIPTYVCASGATPLVAMLVAKGVSPGAAVAFLLTGPATNATTFGVLARLHGARLALAFGLLVGGLAIAIGYGVNALVITPAVFDAHAHPDHASIWQQIGLGLLAGLYLTSLFRQGPRAFLAHVFPYADASHDHDHDHDRDHDGDGAAPTEPSEGGCCSSCH